LPTALKFTHLLSLFDSTQTLKESPQSSSRSKLKMGIMNSASYSRDELYESQF
jgi:hypothetical protein